MIIVSACLCGENCKYNGGNNKSDKVLDFIKDKDVIYVCPEEFGGLSTPRDPSEIIGTAKGVINGSDKIKTYTGNDVTKEFLKGALKTLEIVKKNNVRIAILKAKSPSCGKRLVYDGTFSGSKIIGNGVTAELLIENGVKVLTEEEV